MGLTVSEIIIACGVFAAIDLAIWHDSEALIMAVHNVSTGLGLVGVAVTLHFLRG